MPKATALVLELYARKGCAECRASAVQVVAVARRLLTLELEDDGQLVAALRAATLPPPVAPSPPPDTPPARPHPVPPR